MRSLENFPKIAQDFSVQDRSSCVNDHHSQLNETEVQSVEYPCSKIELQNLVRQASELGLQVSISGGRHAMGGQQFLSNGMLLDLTNLKQVLHFDRSLGLITVEAGIMWPALVEHLRSIQLHNDSPWTISQKQTGCDKLTIGGALAANIHGRGLNKAPIVQDVESFEIILHDGSIRTCSRAENPELCRLAIGGYGLFGVICTVTLRLVRQVNLKRTVRICSTASCIVELERARSLGATFGDFQFAIDDTTSQFLQTGILSTYAPVDQPIEAIDKKLLSESQWQELLYLAHTNKSLAFAKYKEHYLATDGQLYCSDSFQSATYIEGYHNAIDQRIGSLCKGSEAITELYVPRRQLGNFMQDAAHLLRDAQASVIYGTVRLIEKDDETFLPWATESWACIVFNLHVDHEQESIAKLKRTFRAMYALAIEYGGKYYLTYNRFATAEQLLKCYPQVPQFLKMKRKYDPHCRFRSDWYDYVADQAAALKLGKAYPGNSTNLPRKLSNLCVPEI